MITDAALKDVTGISLKENKFTYAPEANIVKGKVTNSKGEPLAGVSVTIKGINTGVTTDDNGNYSITAPGNGTLIFSYIDFITQEVAVNNQTIINVRLLGKNNELDEVVVTGYISQRKKDITGAVSVINVKDMNKQPTAQLSEQLQGQASGITVIGSGQPGEEPQITIRGVNTFGNNTPLFIIDGVPTQNISDINPNDVASVQVLKDAGAASIYGSRASNGVIVITTKRGSGKVKVTYDSYYGTQRPPRGNVWNILSPQDMAQLKFNALANSGTPVDASHPDPLYGTGPIPVLPDYLVPIGAKEGDPSVDPSLYNVNPNYTDPNEFINFYRITRANKAGTNWYEEVTRPAPIQNHNLSISGGSEQGKYFLSLEYFNQEGSVIYTHSKRYSIRANTEFNISKRIKVGENLNYSITDNKKMGYGEGNSIGNSYREQPIIPVYDIKGNFAGTFTGLAGSTNNPVADAYRSRNDGGLDNRLFGNVYSDLDILHNLTFHTSLGGESLTGTSHSFSYPTYENSQNVNKNSYMEGSYYGINWTWTNTLNYHKAFGNHSISLLAGTEAFNSDYRIMGGSNTDYFSFDPNYTTLSSGAGAVAVASNRSTESLWSQYGRLDYSYKDRYLLSGTIRRDGSSKFINKKYGIFPAVTAAWRLSQEKIMRKVSWISDLKVRAGYGIMGNQFNLGPSNGYFTYTSDKAGSFYDIARTNNSIQEGFQAGQIGNPNAKWEKDINTNIGLDATLFNNRINFSIDYYIKDIKDLLFNPDLPATAGSGIPPFVNIARMRNTGVDF